MFLVGDGNIERRGGSFLVTPHNRKKVLIIGNMEIVNVEKRREENELAV